MEGERGGGFELVLTLVIFPMVNMANIAHEGGGGEGVKKCQQNAYLT